MFTALSKLIGRYPYGVLAFGLALVLAGVFYGTGVFSNLKGGGFDNPASDSARATALFKQQLGGETGLVVVLFTSRDGLKVSDPLYREAVEQTLAKFKGHSLVRKIVSFYDTQEPRLVSNDQLSTYAVVDLRGLEEEQNQYVKDIRPKLSGDRLLVRLGGDVPINQEISDQVVEDFARAETFTFPILAVLLILVFGSLVAASLPLLIGSITILGAFLLLRIISSFSDLSIFAINTVTMLGLGLAIDYSLLIVSRFRDELVLTKGDVPTALTRTIQTAGRTVFFSGLTVATGLLSLLVFPQMFLRSMGIGGAATVVVAMLAAMTILPAALRLLGSRVNSLSVGGFIKSRQKQKASSSSVSLDHHGFWYRISHFVIQRPVLVLVAALTPLLLSGLPLLHVNLSIPDARSLPEGRDSRTVQEILTRDFARNSTEPIFLVVQTRQGDVLEPGNIGTLFDYTRQLKAVPGVRQVDSLVTFSPDLDKVGYQNFFSQANRDQNPQAAGLAAQFANKNYTLVQVLYDTDPLSQPTQQLVKNIRAVPVPNNLNALVGGNPAQLVDFLNNLGETIPVALALIIGAIFILLFLMLGSLVVPLKAIVLNMLSLSASYGALVWIFQDGYLSDLFGFKPLGSIDGTQPILIFAIAFGLSMDYEVFLLSRIKEQYDNGHDLAASISLGVQKTGQIITCAALLLFIVIAAFASGEIIFIKQLGVGLGLAIIVDATIVRILLVPATMRLMGKYNWWAPGPLVKLHKWIGFGETSHAVPVLAQVQPARPVVAQLPEVNPLPMGAGALRPIASMPLNGRGFIPDPARFIPAPVVPANGSQYNPTNESFKEMKEVPLQSNLIAGNPAGNGNHNGQVRIPDIEPVFSGPIAEIAVKNNSQSKNDLMVSYLCQLSQLCIDLGKVHEAADYYHQALHVLQENKADFTQQITIMLRLSDIYLNYPDPLKAVEICQAGLKLSRQAGEIDTEINFLLRLAEITLKLGEIEKGIDSIRQVRRMLGVKNNQVQPQPIIEQKRPEPPQPIGANPDRQLSKPIIEQKRPEPPQQPEHPAIEQKRPEPPQERPNLKPVPVENKASNDDMVELLYEKGKSYQQTQLYNHAINAYSRALELNPRLVKCYVNRAIVFNQVGEHELAVEDYSQAIALEPNDAVIYFNRGNAHVYRKDYIKALADYNEALRLNPSDEDALYNRAEVSRKLKLAQENKILQA